MRSVRKEKVMPRSVRNQLNKIDCNVEGENTESCVLDLASELGYEVEDEYDGNRDKEGGYMHNVKVVNAEGHVAWIHFNHPGPDYANRNGEWFWYIM